MSGLRERKKREKLDRIKASAWSLFQELGYEATTTRAICQAAGIGTGTLFSYVEDKSELLVMCFGDQVMPLLDAAIAQTPDGCVERQLASVHHPLLSFYARDLQLGRSILRNILFVQGRGRTHLAGLNFQLQLHTANLLEAARERGEISAHAPIPMLAALVFGAYFSTLIAMLDNHIPNVDVATAMFEMAIKIQLDGSRPSPPTPRGAP
ncbi:MAG: TetR/AcrR family transcriptional regulator [Myxococcota bacterium]